MVGCYVVCGFFSENGRILLHITQRFFFPLVNCEHKVLCVIWGDDDGEINDSND
jgi:hypothetical protein